MMALMLDAQTLLTVVQTVEFGRPAPIAHWRAGFCPRLGEMGQFAFKKACSELLTWPRGHFRRRLLQHPGA